MQIFGYSLYASPPASQVVSLLNICNSFRKHKKAEELVETEILLSYSLINARRFLQAAELLRKSSNFFVAQYELSMSQQRSLNKTGNLSRNTQNYGSIKITRDTQLTGSLMSQTQQIKAPGTSRLMLRAAKLETIFADAINQHSMSDEKIGALQRAAEYFSGQRVISAIRVSPSHDTYSALLKISPTLCKFLTKCLNDKLEPLRVAAIRTLEFILEHLGCSIGSYLPHILKAVLLTYPSQNFLTLNSNRDHMGKNDLDPLDAPLNMRSIAAAREKYKERHTDNDIKQRKNATEENYSQLVLARSATEMSNLSNHKFYTDIYNHLLEDILNVLTWSSSPILITIFQDILLPNIFLADLNNDLKIYFFRISEKIINICQGDLNIGVSFYSNMFEMLEIQNVNVRIAAQKLWEAVKAKIVFNLDTKSLTKILEWISDSLYVLAEDQNIPPENVSTLNYLLDLLAVICSRETNNEVEEQQTRPVSRIMGAQDPLSLVIVLKPLIFWIELIADSTGNKLDLFKSIWVVTIELLKICPKSSCDLNVFEIAYPLLWKVCRYCQESSPTQYILNFLIIIFSAIKVKI